jgi:hypothetical protein
MSKYSNCKYLIQSAQCIFCIVRRRGSGNEYKRPKKRNVYLADCLWFMCEGQQQISVLPTEITGRLTPPIAEEKAHFKTDSLWRRQSQQSSNTLAPFNFLFYSLQVSAPMGHPQVRYTISYYICFWRTILIQRIRCAYAIWYRDVICCRRYFNL